MTQQWQASMPANIALIKYMGKRPGQHAINASLSYTLEQYLTTVTLTLANATSFRQPNTWPKPAQKRFISHLNYLKSTFSISEHFTIDSSNNFPSDCGLASSASSFAALTQCFFNFMASHDRQSHSTTPESIAYHSSKGSGSSGRSFFKPWGVWEADTFRSANLPYDNLNHRLIMIDNQPKRVSSSEAHQRVRTSSHYQKRAARANERFNELTQEISNKNWDNVRAIAWDEFQDMHALFHTSQPPFSYFQPHTIQCLDLLKDSLINDKNGPVITMDAGCNIHLLFKKASHSEPYLDMLHHCCKDII